MAVFFSGSSGGSIKSRESAAAASRSLSLLAQPRIYEKAQIKASTANFNGTNFVLLTFSVFLPLLGKSEKEEAFLYYMNPLCVCVCGEIYCGRLNALPQRSGNFFPREKFFHSA
jgi:hypothetical protein